MIKWLLKLLARWRKPLPVKHVRVPREYEVTEDGLRPLYREHEQTEVLLSRRDAEKFLDDFAINGWKHMGEPPCTLVNGKQMYSESDLFQWLEGE